MLLVFKTVSLRTADRVFKYNVVVVVVVVGKVSHSGRYLVEQVMRLLVWLASCRVSRSEADEKPESNMEDSLSLLTSVVEVSVMDTVVDMAEMESLVL